MSERQGCPVVGAVIQARVGSSRLPRKIFRPLAGKPLIAHVVERLRQCRKLDRIVLATSKSPDDRELLRFAAAEGIDAYAGSEDDVLARFLGAARKFKLEVIVRICSDSPLIDWVTIDRMIERVIARRADYAIYDERIPNACEGIEVVTTAALRRVARITDHPTDHEHVTIYIRQHPDRFKFLYQPIPPALHGRYRMSVDVYADYEFMSAIYRALYRPGKPIDLRRAVRWLKKHQEVMNFNARIRQKPVNAVERRALVLAGEDALSGRQGERLALITRRLAERLHVVITLASPAPAEYMERFADYGFRIVVLPAANRGISRAVLRRTIEESAAQLILYDSTLCPDEWMRALQTDGRVCLSLAERIGDIKGAFTRTAGKS